MSEIRYDIEKIKRNPINRENAKLMPELVRYAQLDLQHAKRLPHANAVQEKVKIQALDKAQLVLDERMGKYKMYKECFPDLFESNKNGKMQ